MSAATSRSVRDPESHGSSVPTGATPSRTAPPSGTSAFPGPVPQVVDPNEPPLPPKVTVEQAKNLAESLVRGTPHPGEIALTVASDTVRELV